MHQVASSKAKNRPLVRPVNKDDEMSEVELNMMAIVQSQSVCEVRAVM